MQQFYVSAKKTKQAGDVWEVGKHIYACGNVSQQGIQQMATITDSIPQHIGKL